MIDMMMLIQLILFQQGMAYIPINQHRVSHKPLASTVEIENEAAGEKRSARESQLPDMEAYASGYQTLFEELPFHSCEPYEGSVPSDLSGTFFRTGPAMFSAGSIVPPKTSIVQPKQGPIPDGQDPSRMVLHPFEGDGAVLAVTFSDDEAGVKRVSARHRMVRTTGFTSERKKGAKLYDGMDSTRATMGTGCLENDIPLPLYRHHLLPGLNKKRKHTANTRAIYWGKRLFNLWEGGLPYKIDGLALQTEGKSLLGGAIPKEIYPFGSKMVYDSEKNRALFHSVEVGSKTSELLLYEFDDSFKLVRPKKSIPIPGVALLHDFAATAKYAIFVQPAVKVDGFKFMLDRDPSSVMKLERGVSATMHLVRRDNDSEARSIPVPVDAFSDANMQFINAYESSSTIVLDVIRSDESDMRKGALRWPWGSTLDEYRSAASKKSLWRYTVDVDAGTIEKERLLDKHVLFATISPATGCRPHKRIYATVGATGSEASPPQGLLSYDTVSGSTQEWIPKPFEFCSEPIYAPRDKSVSDADDGYILSVLYNGQQKESELIVFDARAIAAGPICRMSLNTVVPHGHFGCFTTAKEACWDPDEMLRRAKLSDKMESRGNMWNEVKSDFSGLGLRFDDFEEYFGMDMNDFFTLPKDRK